MGTGEGTVASEMGLGMTLVYILEVIDEFGSCGY
jgi:hypothetical protein